MRFRDIALIFTLSCISVMNAASIQIITPGTLAELAKEETAATTMTVSGNIDARDLYFISETLTELKELNLSEAKINAYSSKTPFFCQEIEYKADELPKMCFFNKEYTSLVLPKDLKAILNGAVAGCKKLTAIAIPEKVEKIEDYAFYDCNALETVIVPASVKRIGSYVFAGCDALKTATLNTAVPAFTFYNCTALSGVTLPDSAAEIGESAFRGCNSLTQFTFPTELKSIAADAFKGTKLAAIDFSKCKVLTAIGDWAFADNYNLKTVKFSNSIRLIGVGTFFANSSIQTAELPQTNLNISDFLFAECSGMNCPEIISEGVAAIGKYAFDNWIAIDSFKIPASVQMIDDCAFRNNTGLTEITVNTPSVPELGANVFEGVAQPNVMLKVVDALIPDYKAAEQWKEFNIQTLSSVDETLADSGVKAYFEGSVLVVAASEEIAETLLFDVNGLQLTHSKGGDSTITYETADFSNNFYILAVKLASGKRCAMKVYR